MAISVVFIQDGGKGTHTEDALLATSLEQALGSKFDVRYPRMRGESEPDLGSWKQQILSTLQKIYGEVILAGHFLGGAASDRRGHVTITGSCHCEKIFMSYRGRHPSETHSMHLFVLFQTECVVGVLPAEPVSPDNPSKRRTHSHSHIGDTKMALPERHRVDRGVMLKGVWPLCVSKSLYFLFVVCLNIDHLHQPPKLEKI